MTRPYESLTLSQVVQLPRPGTAVPGAWTFTPDGTALLYLHSPDGSMTRGLWRYDLATARRTELLGPGTSQPLSREEELRRERQRILSHGVTQFFVAQKAADLTVLVPQPSGLQLLAGGETRELPGTAGVVAPCFSPQGTHVAYVRAGDLHSYEIVTGNEARLTNDAEDGLTNGLAEFIAQEELDRAHGTWWSPDGRSLAFIRADSRHIPNYTIVHQGKDELDAEQHRYPFAGAPNAILQVGVVAAAGGEVRGLDLGQPDDDFYIPRVHWRPDGRLAVHVLSRDQRHLQLLLFDVESGEIVARLEERSEPWLNTDNNARFLDSNELLWASERTGYRHLYLYDEALNETRQLTAGDWLVTHVNAVDEQARQVYFEATRESPLERHLYRVSLDGGEPERLTTEAGWHHATVSPKAGAMVETFSCRAHAPVIRLRALNDSDDAVALFANEGTSAATLGLPEPQFLEVEAEDGTPLHGALYLPPSGETEGPPPLIVSVYGGPHAQRVIDEWSMTVDLRAQYLAQQGYAVLRLDNRGAANRGLAFEAHLANRMGTVELDDQVTAVQQLAAQGVIDPSRVGIYGWSYGGYMSCMALVRAPGTFRVAVAGAPVTHWDGYDTCYTERYMETPQSNPEGYEDGSVMAHVEALEGKLLLVHGMVDENVHFRHTARLMTALTRAAKEYDLLVFPEERHVPRDAAGLEYMERRLVDYFDRHL